MNYAEVMSELEALGTAQNRKVYARHGIQGEMFGVSYGNLGKLVKKLKTDQALAESLWASGNHDAGVLATKIADPDAMKSRQIDQWAKGASNYVLAGALSGLVARTPHAAAKRAKWVRAKSEFLSTMGWDLISAAAALAESDGGLDAETLASHVETIEASIHEAPNRTRYAMNNALINIGLRGGALEAQTLASAARIGKVEVDHGETGCKTPDAASYIAKTKAYRARKAAGKKSTRKKSTKKKVAREKTVAQRETTARKKTAAKKKKTAAKKKKTAARKKAG